MLLPRRGQPSSIVFTADADDGNNRVHTPYDEYGVHGSNAPGRFGYTGQAWVPEAGLYYYKARMYSPGLGRFMQTDPIGYADGMNVYRYVGNEPVNFVDPTGLSCEQYPGGYVTFYDNNGNGEFDDGDTQVEIGVCGGGDGGLSGFFIERRPVLLGSGGGSGGSGGTGGNGGTRSDREDICRSPNTDVAARAEGAATVAEAGLNGMEIAYDQSGLNASTIRGANIAVTAMGAVGTAVQSAGAGETMDVTFARIVLPAVGGIAGGALGVVAGTALGGGFGAVVFGAGGAALGTQLGTELANWIAADAPRPRGCR